MNGSEDQALVPNAAQEIEFMKIAVDEGCDGVQRGEGGPFGAVIIRNGQIVSRGHNRVLQTNDPTAHAEVVAIRDACAKLGRFSLHDCIIYASCQPCPMCLAAIHWAKIPRAVYAATADDAAAVGFDDRFLYDVLQGRPVDQKCTVVHLSHPDAIRPFTMYTEALQQNKSGRY